MTFGLRCSGPACRPHPASLPVRVPTVESLPPASFGFPLAVAPCGLATVAVIGPDWLLSSNKTLPMLGTPRGRPPGRPASRRPRPPRSRGLAPPSRPHFHHSLRRRRSGAKRRQAPHRGRLPLTLASSRSLPFQRDSAVTRPAASKRRHVHLPSSAYERSHCFRPLALHHV